LIRLLLADDSSDDIVLFKRNLTKAGVDHVLHTVDIGDAAIAYLEGKDRYEDRNAFPLPDVVFLDIKMPCRSGFEVLEWMRANPALDALPVFIISGASEPCDVQRGQELGAVGFLEKPVSTLTLCEILGRISNYQGLRHYLEEQPAGTFLIASGPTFPNSWLSWPKLQKPAVESEPVASDNKRPQAAVTIRIGKVACKRRPFVNKR